MIKNDNLSTSKNVCTSQSHITHHCVFLAGATCYFYFHFAVGFDDWGLV